MKKIIQLVCLLFIANSFAQKNSNYKTILDLDNTDINVDFQYNISKKIPEKIVQKWFTNGHGEFKDANTEEYIFDSKSLKIKNFRYKYTDTKYDQSWTNYTYAYKQNRIKKVTISENEKISQVNFYTYDKQNRVTMVNMLYGDIKLVQNYRYPNDSTIIMNTIKNDIKLHKTLSDTKGKFTLKNGNIIKKSLSQPEISTEYIDSYKYDENNLLIKKSSYKELLGAYMFSKDNISYEYSYNDDKLIKEVFTLKGASADITKTKYDYIIDAYGNWIAKFKFYPKNLLDFDSEKIAEIHIRSIKYSDKTVTGFTSIDVLQIQDYLESKKIALLNAPKDGVYFSKSSNTATRLYLNGENISKRLMFVKIIGNDMFANDSVANIFYQLKDFKSKPIKKEYYKATIFAKKNEGVWYKNEKDGGFWFIVNGKYLKNLKVITATTNRKNRIVFVDNVPTYVVLYEDANPFEMQKAIPYKDYLKTHPNEVLENIPSGSVWKKEEDGFWFYSNGENRSQKINYTFFGNHCVIYDLIDKKSYLIKDLKAKTTGDFNNAIELKGNVFWLKFKENRYILIKNATENVLKAEYAQNNTDVILLNDNKEKVYVLKNYNNAEQNKLLPVINYSDYTEKPSADYLLNDKVKNCNADKECLKNLYAEVYDLYYNSSTKDQLAQKMADYIVKVYNVHPHLAFTVLLTNKRNNNILEPLMDKLPENIRTSLKNNSRQMLEDYNKYINSKEVRDKVKENGGGYIKNKN